MTIPTLTPTQIFQNSVNAVPNVLAQMLSNNPQSIASTYARLYSSLFGNPNGTAAAAMTNLGTGAANVLSILAALYTMLNGCGVTGLTALPAYTANSDGTVTLS